MENGKAINIVNESNMAKYRRSSNHQVMRPDTNPSPTSDSIPSSQIINRNFSYTALPSKGGKNLGSPFSGSEIKRKHLEVLMEPETPFYQHLELREPKKEDFWIGRFMGKGRFGDVHLVKHK